uniref:RHS repeat protein n=1 Tax=Syphacia muris TaxID=451379 RepID=A0A0N5B1L9_9BILA
MTLDDVISDFDTLNTLLLNNKFENITEWEGVKGTYPFNDSYIIRPEGWQISKQNRSWYTDGEEQDKVNCQNGICGCAPKVAKGLATVALTEVMEGKEEVSLPLLFYVILDGKISHYFEYDENGNMVTEYYYDEDGAVDWRNSYTREYNETGKMISENSFFENGSVYERQIWEYDLDDRIIAEGYFCGGYQLRYIYGYDRSGNRISKYMHKEQNGKTWDGYVEKYKYDDNGNLIAEYSYKDDGTIIWVSSHLCEYDQDNKKLAQYSYDNDDMKYVHYRWSYDNKGKVLAEQSYNPDGSVDWWNTKMYKYDTNGKMIEKSEFHEDGSIRRLTLCEYDKDGNLETESEYNDGDILYRICKYDSDGRIITEKVYNDDGSVNWLSSSAFDPDKSTGSLVCFHKNKSPSEALYHPALQNQLLELLPWRNKKPNNTVRGGFSLPEK